MANNVKFSYLYSDGGNYKSFGEVVFSNADDIELAEIEMLIRSKLIDGIYFYHKEFKLPSLITTTFDYEVDPTWHEFESVTFTCQSADFSLCIRKWLRIL